MEPSLQVRPGYFYISNFDMWGADIDESLHHRSFPQAIIAAKRLINQDSGKCAVIVNGGFYFSIYLKSTTQSNPTKSRLTHICTTLFFGQRVNEIYSRNKKIVVDPQQRFDYYFVKNLDMFGGSSNEDNSEADLYEAMKKMKKIMALDGTLCGTINKSKGKYRMQLKDLIQTNPSTSQKHNNSIALFYGRSA